MQEGEGKEEKGKKIGPLPNQREIVMDFSGWKSLNRTFLLWKYNAHVLQSDCTASLKSAAGKTKPSTF